MANFVMLSKTGVNLDLVQWYEISSEDGSSVRLYFNDQRTGTVFDAEGDECKKVLAAIKALEVEPKTTNLEATR